MVIRFQWSGRRCRDIIAGDLAVYPNRDKVMSTRYVLVIASAMIALAPVQTVAKGAPVVFHAVAMVPPVVPRALPSTFPDVSADKLLRGCGTHRYRDPTTQQCRSF